MHITSFRLRNIVYHFAKTVLLGRSTAEHKNFLSQARRRRWREAYRKMTQDHVNRYELTAVTLVLS